VTYRRSLLTRWSRRDRLAVLVVATVVALLVGSTLVVVTAADETTRLAAHLNSTGTVASHDDPATARANAPDDALVLPTATATVDGESVTVVGVPESDPPPGVPLPQPPDSGTVRVPSKANAAPLPNATLSLAGESQTVQVRTVSRESTGVVPSWWYVGDTRSVDRLGATGAVVVTLNGANEAAVNSPARDAPLVGGLPFFVRGTEQLLAGLAAVTAGIAVLVVVVVFSVTRMTVDDRLATLAVLRATGLDRRRLVALFAARAAILTAVGVLAGAAAGVVLTNAAVNAVVFAGLPTTLSLQVTPRAAGLLGPALLAVLGVGAAAGTAATLPAARASPGVLARRAEGATTDGGGLLPFDRLPTPAVPERLRPELLPAKAIVPTAATLAVFIAVVLVALTMASTVAPLSTPDETAVVQSGSGNPWSSRVDADYATALRGSGVDASPEVLVFSVVNEDPFLTRGVEFDAFATVSDASLVRGRAPQVPEEAVVGQGLARSTDLDVGETFALGGGNRPSFARVTVVGVYRAPGLYDDHLLVPLSTARHLSNTGPGSVNLIRVSGNETPTAEGRPGATPDGTPTTPGDVSGDETSTATPDGPTLRFAPVPDAGPPGATLLIIVQDRSGRPVTNATVSLGPQSVATDDAGRAAVTLPEAGSYRLTASKAGYRDASRQFAVSPGTDRRLIGSLAVASEDLGPLDRPVVSLSLANPWNRTLSRRVTVDGAGTRERAVELEPGEGTTTEVELDRPGPGTHRVTATVDGRRIAETTVTVRGDDRIVAALATGGRTETVDSGLGRAASTAFGNLRVLLGTLVALAGVATIATTTAAFARAVHSRRRTVGIYRATGATPRQLFVIILGNAARIAAPATLLALVLGYAGTWLLARIGVLTAFGVSLVPTVSVPALAATAAGTLVLALAGAAVAAAGLVRAQPAALFDRGAGTPTAAASDGGESDA
jgi:ABC-type lipoprotein release transport system permease subunit